MPEAGRQDYNELIRFTQLQPGEPYFFIRARDAASGPAVRAWAALALQRGAPAALVESALQQADALDAWPDKHVPGVEHLSAEEIRSLEYQLDRRAWRSRDATVTGAAISETILLAERRGARAAESRVRNADELLRLVLEAMAPVLASSGSGVTTSALAKAQAVCAAAQCHLQRGSTAHG